MEIDLNKMFNEIIKSIDKKNKPNLFLHVCCGPCSSAVFKKVYEYFNVFVIFYNPNIDTKDEFLKRYNELYKVLKIEKYNIKVLYDDYNHKEFLEYVSGYENELEGKKRCELCFNLRLKMTYNIAYDYIIKNNLHDKENYICSTLSISPHKDANKIQNIGDEICNGMNNSIKYLPSDFKKENGYLKSIELSRVYGLYRQNYCGCEFSKNA